MDKIKYAIIPYYDCHYEFLRFLKCNKIKFSTVKVLCDYGMFGIECELSPADLTAIELAIGNTEPDEDSHLTARYRITTEYSVVLYV